MHFVLVKCDTVCNGCSHVGVTFRWCKPHRTCPPRPAELGGSIALRMCYLDGWPGDWRAHLRQAGCEDAIAVIETAADERQAVDAVLALRTAGG
ncbi:hypothetical protein WI42_25355 [Burkholderia ubonensis]|nr:hypothetical protein WI42_25355 [Burkholderia ubonensis]KVA21330.1 hypothetical protein WI43_01180 [Burkholderia ubonensis]KVA46265.1 hypothetical protein WI46_05920 [Burkholderia ubonensis]